MTSFRMQNKRFATVRFGLLLGMLCATGLASLPAQSALAGGALSASQNPDGDQGTKGTGSAG